MQRDRIKALMRAEKVFCAVRFVPGHFERREILLRRKIFGEAL